TPVPHGNGPLLLTLLLLTYWAAMDVLNPAIPNPLMGIIGLRTLVFYVPLVWIASALITDWSGVRNLMYVLALPCLVVCSAAAVEFVRGPDWYASLGPGFAAARWGVTGFSGLS